MNAFVAEVERGDVFLEPVRATGVADPRSADWIVGHVRLDGREGLRDALGGAGVPTPRQASDLDLVLLAWRAWRETSTERLRGDFSFAIWDTKERVLFCARDPIGIRPLYWAETGGNFVCGNELDSVRAHAGVSSRLHEPAIVSFLRFGYNDDLSTTSFADIHRLPPAHQFVVRAGAAIAPRRYWSFPVPAPLRLSRDEDYIERFREVLGDAVRDRLCEDRAAILLSGGLDSTSLAATARRVSPDVELTAWTHDMGEFAPRDEVSLAAGVAQRLGIAHDIAREPGATLEHLARRGFRTPEPLDETDWAFWTDQLARIAQRAPVLVIGEDGDALFSPPGLLATLRAWPLHDVLGRALSYTFTHRHHPHLGIWLRRRLRAPFVPRAAPAPKWIRADVLARSGSSTVLRTAAHPTRPEAVRFLSDPVWQSVLEPSQPAYTGVQLDMVWPLLDTRVIDFVFSIPPVPWCQKKELVRRAFRGELPDAILTRRKSPLPGFFENQVAAWRASLRAGDLGLGDEVGAFVDSRMVAGTLRSGTEMEVSAAWRALMLDQWLRNVGL